MSSLVQAILTVGAVTTALGAVGVVLRWAVRKVWRPVGEFLRDWHGEEARPGVPEVPGVMARLECLDCRVKAVEAQAFTNGGSSMKDQLNRIEDKLDIEDKLAA